MLSLKKVASAENGWSFSEMTTVRRADEVSSVNVRYDGPARPLIGGYRARKGFRTQGMGDLEEVSTGVPEEMIGMAIIRSLEEPIGDW